jgi:hypothetical protein
MRTREFESHPLRRINFSFGLPIGAARNGDAWSSRTICLTRYSRSSTSVVSAGLRIVDSPKKEISHQQRGQNSEYRSANNVGQIMRLKIEPRKSD